ncbi:MAG: GntR family transcriptional regulator [Betaproteobacteria bacterium]
MSKSPPDSLHAPMRDVQQRLRSDIVSGVFPFGARLIIEELAIRYGVSHMPIREALRILHGEGLVVIEPNRGAHVRPIYRGFIEDLFDVRAAIETMLARRAAERRTAAHMTRLREAAAKLEAHVASGSFEDVPVANREFHAAINDAAGNPGALPIVDSHWLLLAALLKRYGYGDRRFARVIEEHRHMIQAIERRDGHSAAMLMGAHIEQAKNNLLQRAAAESATEVERA